MDDVTEPERRVLVVEDGEMQTLVGLMDHLREHDFFPVAVTTAAEAFDLFEVGYRLDAAVISLCLPDESKDSRNSPP